MWCASLISGLFGMKHTRAWMLADERVALVP